MNEVTIAMINDSSVMGRSKATFIGRWNDSMPMKCIDQMPVPIDIAPATSQITDFLALESLALIRPAMSSAVYEAMMATATERATIFRS
jgi:hypothetical protein